jgi:hypothetical protein
MQKISLADHETGGTFPVTFTKTGSVQNAWPGPSGGKRYFVLFANSNKSIKRGQRITLIMDGYRVEDLMVEGSTRPILTVPKIGVWIHPNTALSYLHFSSLWPRIITTPPPTAYLRGADPCLYHEQPIEFSSTPGLPSTMPPPLRSADLQQILARFPVALLARE